MKANELKFSDIDRLIVDNVEQGEFWVHRDLYRDPAVFELEMRYIFERNWVFVGLDSQAPNPNDTPTRGTNTPTAWCCRCGGAQSAHPCAHTSSRTPQDVPTCHAPPRSADAQSTS